MEQLMVAVCEDDRDDRDQMCGLIEARSISANVTAFEGGENFLSL